MNLKSAEKIVNAVLYEGYILYPYRPTAIKNRQRWTFGGLFPAGSAAVKNSGDNSSMQTQALLLGDGASRLDVRVRFLHLVARQAGELQEPVRELPEGREPDYRPVSMIAIDGRQHFTWQEAVEREVAIAIGLDELCSTEKPVRFAFSAERDIEPLRGAYGWIGGVLVRSQLPVEGQVTLSAEPVTKDAYRLTVVVENRTGLGDPALGREEAQLQAMVSTHTIVGIEDGRFVSLLDPPERLQAAAAACDNRGCWPVLVGPRGRDDTLLSSPIILYDYPQIAPESPGDLFDGLEIDELLTLRILTMTPEEKREMAAVDERARALLERTERLTPDQMQAMHGALREPRSVVSPPGCNPEQVRIRVGGLELGVGDRVRLHPKEGGDVFDMVLKGKSAVIEGIERDFEDRVHLAVAIDDDPGRDMGLARMPGHRFFFSPEEVEALGGENDTGACP